jgi:enoyl-CoA hydratase/carnithine racemase
MSRTTAGFVSVERLEQAAIVTLRRPERRNALSLEVMRELTDVIRILGEDASARVIVIAGEGAAFSAGHDLAELCNRDERAYREIFGACVDLMESIRNVPQPVIAEVSRIATAAGCQLVATCDLAVASTEATFATPGVRIGLFCSTPMVPLTRAIGPKRAMEMLLTGEMIDAETALSWGLVNRVVPPAELRAAVLTLAHRIAESSGSVVAVGKRAFYAQLHKEEAEAYALTKEVMTENAQAADAQEGIAAFLEKRSPRWTSESDSANIGP